MMIVRSASPVYALLASSNIIHCTHPGYVGKKDLNREQPTKKVTSTNNFEPGRIEIE